jgi:hypothetical protein
MVVESNKVRDQRGEASRGPASDVLGEALADGAERGPDAESDEMNAWLPRHFSCL